jgi:hypothetical protein
MALLLAATVLKNIKSAAVFIRQIFAYFDFTPHFSTPKYILPLPIPPLDGDRSSLQTVAGMIA